MTENQKLREALRELMSIVSIHQKATRNNFAWAEMKFAEEALALPTADHLPDAGEMVVDHFPDATKMIETAAPVGERERFEAWWRTVQMRTFPKEYDIKRLQDWGSAYKPKSLEAWQARAALSAGDAVDAQRLDFIEKSARCDPKMDGQHVWWPTSFNTAQLLKGPTLREALDNAIRARKDNT